jgi:transcriptional regulator with PAS, ATPase and Fis domain
MATQLSREARKLLNLKFGITGNSPLILEAMEKIILAAPTDITVLITGETGTGKEVFAKAIHGLSKRSKKPFISVNCGAIPETLLESELFGHEKGAFTGAVEQRKGFFEVADKGTIFLDEIGEMPLSTQVKILRVLETGEFTRLGSTQLKKVDVRIIAATNRNLAEEVSQGTFRQDLYFRLNSIHIVLPPLRNRPEDIKELVDEFASKTCRRIGLKYDGIAPDALTILKNLPWPGNVRELKNLIETLVTLEQVTYITADILRRYIPKALPEKITRPAYGESSIVHLEQIDSSAPVGLDIIFKSLLELKREMNDIKQMLHTLANQIESTKNDIITNQNTTQYQEYQIQPSTDSLNLTDMEKELITLALNKHDGNRRLAAKELGISERTLYRKIADYNIK